MFFICEKFLTLSRIIMLEKELQKIGLSEKEAKVYLASLELGPSPVQKISQKAKVNRATTYVVIDDLKSMGLMSTFDEGKKTYFVPEKPERLLVQLRSRENDIKEKINLLQERLPELKSIFNVITDKPKVKYYEGKEGLKAVQDDFIESLKKGGEILAFLPYDQIKTLGFRIAPYWQKRASLKITTKIIYSSRAGRQADFEEELRKYYSQACYIPYDKFPIAGGVNIYSNKIFLIDYKGKLGGILVENSTLAELHKNIFLRLWEAYYRGVGA